jgi:hypothetical protein
MTKSIFIFSIILMTNLVWSQISTVSRSTLSTGTGNQITAVGPGGGDPIDIPIADRVRFLYDESGNQRERQICINCTANKPSGQVDDITS